MKISNNLSIIILIFAFLLQVNKTFAQKKVISGTVFNAKTDSILPDVKIIVIGVIEYTKSDINGKYSLSIPDSIQTVKFSKFSRFDITEIKIVSENNIDIYLSGKDKYTIDELMNLNLEELMKIKVISASKKSQKISDAPSIISVFTKNDIINTGAVTLIDVLKYFPAVETSMGVNGHYRVSIRGNRKDGNILVLINGHHLNNFYDGSVFYDLPVEFIERVEVIRGPGSALFGTNAVAGVINIITVKNENIVKAKVGNLQNFGGDIIFGRSNDNYNFSFSGGYYKTNGANTVPYSVPLDTISEKTNRWLNEIYLQSTYSYKGLNVNIFSLMRKQGSWVGPLYDLSPDSEFKNNNILGNISYDFKIKEKLTIKPKIYTNLIFYDYLTQEHPDGYTIQNIFYTDGALVKEKYLGTTLGSELQADYKINNNIFIINGFIFENLSLQNYDLKRNYQIIGREYFGEFGNYDNVSFVQKNKTRNIFAYYFQSQFNIKKFSVTAGFRYDYYSDFGKSFNPRIGIVYKPTKKLSFKLLYGQAFRAPTFKELYDKTNIDYSGIIGNSSLKPERIISNELGFEYSGKRFLIRTNIFYNITNNIINNFDTDGTGGIGVYENGGSIQSAYLFDVSDFTGMKNTLKSLNFELEGLFQITKQMKYFINISQFNNKFRWKNEEIFSSEIAFLNSNKGSGILKNIPTLRLNSGIFLKIKKITSFIGINYGNASRSNKRFAIEADRFVEIPPYFHLNFNLSYSITKKLNISLTGKNIGKTKFSDPDESTNINLLGDEGMAQPIQSFMISVSFNFGNKTQPEQTP